VEGAEGEARDVVGVLVPEKDAAAVEDLLAVKPHRLHPISLACMFMLQSEALTHHDKMELVLYCPCLVVQTVQSPLDITALTLQRSLCNEVKRAW
jgi:hypothetical protein